MRYEVSLGERSVSVELDLDGRFLIDGRVAAIDAARVDRGRVWSVTLDGRSHEVVVLSPDRLLVDGTAVDVAVVDERAVAARRSGTATASRGRELRAPMPGLLKAVHVRPGDVVDAGASLATLEAMKMENELRATARSRVESVAAAAGTKVEGGALLLVLTEAE